MLPGPHSIHSSIRSTRWRVAEAFAWGVIAVALFVTAWLHGFTNFRRYDDEGLFLLFGRLFLDGAVPYEGLAWIHGPVQVASVHLLHGALGIPLEHAAIRWVLVVTWLTISLLSGVLARQLTASFAWAASASLLTFLYLASIVNEPGHPQGLIAVFLLAALIAVAISSRTRPAMGWLLAGVFVAAVFYTKMNAGLFLTLAVTVVVAGQYCAQRRSAFLHWLLISGALLSPFLLMAPFLHNPDCLAFAALCSLAAGIAAWVSGQVKAEDFLPAIALQRFLIGFSIVTALALLYLACLGTSILGLIVSLYDLTRAQTGFYHHFRNFSHWQLVLALLSCATAYRVVRMPEGHARCLLLCLARCYVLLAALACAFFDNPGISQSMIGWVAPWCWVVITGGANGMFHAARLLLASFAVWLPLLAFPIPGTQLYFGSFLILLSALVAGSDLCRCLRRRRDAGRPGRAAAILAGCLASVTAVLAAISLGQQFTLSFTNYGNFTPLGLPGTGHLRVEPRAAGQYRSLVERSSDADYALTTFRFYSIYFWSPARFPGPDAWSLFQLAYMSSEQQEALRRRLSGLDEVVVIDRIPRGGPPGDPTGPVWIHEDFRVGERIGRYRILRRE